MPEQYTDDEIKLALNQLVEEGILTMFIQDGEVFYVESEKIGVQA